MKFFQISYDDDYRPHIFRILPMLKNLDVIMMPRPPRIFPKKDSIEQEENNEAQVEISVPKELEGCNTFLILNFVYKSKNVLFCGDFRIIGSGKYMP